MKLGFKIFVVALLVLLALSLILSRDATPEFSPLYGLKRLQEEAFLSLKSDKNERLDYMLVLLNNRLYELDRVVRNESYRRVLPAAQRHSTLAGEITNLVIENKMQDKKGLVEQVFNAHRGKVQELYVLYPKNTENVEYKYIEDDLNYLKIYLDQLDAASY